MKNTLCCLLVVLAAACGNSASSVVGASCTKTEDCAAGSACTASKCVALALPANDAGTNTSKSEQAVPDASAPTPTPVPVTAQEVKQEIAKPAGVYDVTFGADGVFSYAGARVAKIVQFSSGHFAALTSDNKIIKALNTGVLDPTFASSGILTVSGTKGDIAHIAIAADRLYVFTQATGLNCGSPSASSLAVLAFDANGQAIASFGTAGVVTIGIAGSGAYRIAETTGGFVDAEALYVTGFTKSECNGSGALDQAVVVKLNPLTGARDSSFGTAGVVAPVGGLIAVATHVVPTAAGLLVIGHSFSAMTNGRDTFVRRILANGGVDNVYPMVSFHSAAYTKPRAVTLNGDKLAIVTETSAINGGYKDVYVAQITAGGALDSSFGTEGGTLFDRPFGLQASSIVADSGSLYVAVQHGDIFANGAASSAQLWKLTAAGTFDPTFDTDGIMDVRYANASDVSLGGYLFIDGDHRACFAGATAAGLAVSGKIVRFSL